jgi:hypothetical protein
MKDLCIACNYAWPTSFRLGLWYTGMAFFILLGMRYGLRIQCLTGFMFGIVAPLFRSIWVLMESGCVFEAAIDKILFAPQPTTNSTLPPPSNSTQIPPSIPLHYFLVCVRQYRRLHSWLALWVLLVSMDSLWLLYGWIRDVVVTKTTLHGRYIPYKERLLEILFLFVGVFLAYTWPA